MPDFNVKVKTTHEGDGAKQAQKELRELRVEAKELETQGGVVTTVLGRLSTKLGSFLIGSLFSAAMGVVIGLLSKAGAEIIEILNLLKKADTVGSFTVTKRTAEEAKAAVQQLAKAFDEASQSFDNLRKKQDELQDAGLATQLAGVDVLEALGVGRGGISTDAARLQRASLRRDEARNRNAKDRRDLSDEQMVIEAQQAASRSDFSKADFDQRRQDIRRDKLLSRASRVLQVPIDKLRDPDVFDREYNAALDRTLAPFVPGDEGSARDRDRPEDMARRKEVESVGELQLLLRSKRTRVTRAGERLADVNALAAEKLPELERREQLVQQREIAGTRTTAADVINSLSQNGGASGLQGLSEALKQFGIGNNQNAREVIAVVRQLIAQQQQSRQELELLKQQTRFYNPYR